MCFSMASDLSHLLYLFLWFLPLSVLAKNISLGSSLSAVDENSPWMSPSGEFAFGFHRFNDSNPFSLSIWFDKIPEKTVVWSANRGSPVDRGSKIELNSEGLILKSPRGDEIWRAEADNGIVASAAMLDAGDFVLIGADNGIKWHSFDNPTDTILPTQILNRGENITSHLTETDYSLGRFQLRMENDGNLVLYTISLPMENTYKSYWASNTENSGDQMVFDQSGYMYVKLTNGSSVNLTSATTVPTRDLYHRAVLDSDGVFRQYVYPKERQGNLLQSWSVLWSEPSDLCWAIFSDLGSGACGFNSYCRLDGDRKPICECPPGYSYLDPNYKYRGCKPDFGQQSCGVEDEGLFNFREMLGVNWPLGDFEMNTPVDEGWCRNACLNDCFCAVAIFGGSSCWKKKLPLSNGRMDPRERGKALIKVRTGNSPLQRDLSPEKNKEGATLVLVGSLLLGSFAFLLILAISVVIFRSYNKKPPKVQPSMLGINLRCFTYKELEEATDGFKNELGRGAFGIVYKGILALDSENFVAVKKLDRAVGEWEKEFKAEVNTIGRTHHKNLVQLLGFSNDGPHRLLVYEFMSNGSLASFLFEGSRPTWIQRTQIAFGIARGLAYLHEECSTQIIHCDIKPQNILLDDYFTAKISDFGLAKLLKTDQSRASTGVRGTRGYVAPEWFKSVPISAKVDVYSFGVLLLEIICCRRSIELELGNEDIAILTDWACDCYNEGRLDALVNTDMEAMNDGKRLQRMVMVAIWCIQEEPSLRPSMKKVTQMLEGTVEISDPPGPSSFLSSIG